MLHCAQQAWEWKGPVREMKLQRKGLRCPCLSRWPWEPAAILTVYHRGKGKDQEPLVLVAVSTVEVISVNVYLQARDGAVANKDSSVTWRRNHKVVFRLRGRTTGLARIKSHLEFRSR